MDRRTFLKSSAAIGIASSLLPRPAYAADREIIVSEPVRSISYLPLYVAIAQGYFKKVGMDVSVLTAEQNGAAINAALSGQAFAFIGGPERVAFARAQGGALRSVVNCVDRGNVYFVAAKGLAPTNGDVASFLKGKTIAVNPRGSSPHSVMHYLLMSKWGLDLGKDVQVIDAPAAVALVAVKTKRAEIAVVSEPQITQGIEQGLWDEPFYNVPKELGPLAYSVLNIQQASIEKEPQFVGDFVAAIMRGLETTHKDQDMARAVAKREFPTMAPSELKATIDRSYADNLWSPDGIVSRQSWDTMHSVVRQIGALKSDVAYEDIIDNRFVEAAAPKLKG